MRALIIDLDGVLRHFDAAEQERIEARHGLAPGAIAQLAFASPLLLDASLGRVIDTVWRDGAVEALVAEAGLDAVAAREAVIAWSASPGVLDVAVLDLVDRVTAPVVVLTNATSRLPADLAKLGCEHRFAAVVNSYDVGAMKPDARCLLAAHARVESLLGGLVAREAVAFVDDSARNVEAGAAFGWSAVRFTGPQPLRAKLVALGLPGLT